MAEYAIFVRSTYKNGKVQSYNLASYSSELEAWKHLTTDLEKPYSSAHLKSISITVERVDNLQKATPC